MFDPKTIQQDFPILTREFDGHRLVYLDNASTSQKPKSVIDALTKYYTHHNANIHRAVYTLAEEATLAYEGTREEVRKFINAKQLEEIIFTRNTTESINLVAYTWGVENIHAGDTIIVSTLEHHSNLVPWQQLAKKTGAALKIIPFSEDPEKAYTLDLEWFRENADSSLKLLAITQASNTTGTIVPVKEFIDIAHAHGAVTLIDAAQSASHMPINVQDLDTDFLAFSSHKMLGPTGVGVLYGKQAILEKMPPFLFGGDMIREVHQYESTWNDLPWKFEAGTPNIADVVAFREALRYLKKLGLDNVLAHDQELVAYAKSRLAEIPQVVVYAPRDTKQMTGIVSFELSNLSIPGLSVHPHDIAEIFNSEGVAIRGGHHCAQPLMEKLKISSTARMSFYIYNTKEDIDAAINAIKKVLETFHVN